MAGCPVSGGKFRAQLTMAAVTAFAAFASPTTAWAASKEDRIFTIGNYPVEARASDAVAAKDKAIKEGQQAALRSLLKRLVPVTAYKRLASVKAVNAGGLVESYAVRSERNSSTDYIASYDFAFSPDPVRKLLEREGIPYLDRQAPQITLVTAYRVAPDAAKGMPQTFTSASGSDAWLYAWKGLDLANSLTPASLQPLKREVHDDTVRLLADGDLGQLRTLGQAYQTETIVLAVLEPEPDLKKIKVVLVGRDAVQNLYLKRSYRLEGLDLAYSAEATAITSLAILEGRWKAINVRSSGDQVAAVGGGQGQDVAPVARPEPGAAVDGGSVPLNIAIAFQGMEEWQEISRRLANTPDVGGLEVLGLSARRARVSLSYPGGPQGLALTLAQQGLILENTREGWLLTRR